MLRGLLPGKEFYYANRNTRKAERCTVVFVKLGYPPEILAKNNITGETFKCYDGIGCYEDENEAFEDAQIQADRIIY